MLSFQSTLFHHANSFSSRFHARVTPNENLSSNLLSNQQFGQQQLGKQLKQTLGVDLSPQQSVNPATNFFDVDAVVDSVLQFVGSRIEQRRAEGASEGELATMYDAARSGVETGFGQAREQIEALGKLDDSLADRINQAEQGIYQGIDKLQAAGEESAADSLPASSLESVQYARVYERETNKFKFEVVTQEGDKVKISARTDSRFYGEALTAQGENDSLAYSATEERNRSRYTLDVKGDLNADELRALDDLMAQVSNLSEEFFKGDVGAAFDMAMNLTSDAEQIAKFSLNLKQRQVSAYEIGSATFTPASPSAPSPASARTAIENYQQPTLPRGLAEPLGHFVRGVHQAFNTAETFAQPQDLLRALFEKMDQQPKLLDLLEPVLGQLQAR